MECDCLHTHTPICPYTVGGEKAWYLQVSCKCWLWSHKSSALTSASYRRRCRYVYLLPWRPCSDFHWEVYCFFSDFIRALGSASGLTCPSRRELEPCSREWSQQLDASTRTFQSERTRQREIAFFHVAWFYCLHSPELEKHPCMTVWIRTQTNCRHAYLFIVIEGINRCFEAMELRRGAFAALGANC